MCLYSSLPIIILAISLSTPFLNSQATSLRSKCLSPRSVQFSSVEPSRVELSSTVRPFACLCVEIFSRQAAHILYTHTHSCTDTHAYISAPLRHTVHVRCPVSAALASLLSLCCCRCCCCYFYVQNTWHINCFRPVVVPM